MSFDDEFGDGALERFRASAEVEPFDTVTLIEPAPGLLAFTMSGPDGARGTLQAGWRPTSKVLHWAAMEVSPTDTGIMGRLAAGFGPALAELGFTETRISAGAAVFEQVGFEVVDPLTDTMVSSVERLVEYSEFKSGGPVPEWRSGEETE